eukprot:2776435-Amphidinium_carterae.1
MKADEKNVPNFHTHSTRAGTVSQGLHGSITSSMGASLVEFCCKSPNMIGFVEVHEAIPGKHQLARPYCREEVVTGWTPVISSYKLIS